MHTGKRKVHSLIDKVWDLRNLRAAWERVKANGGCPGTDGETLERFEAGLEANLTALSEELRQDRYQPRPIRRVRIPKETGGERPLGIPAVRDRVVQAALMQKLEPIFEPLFSDRSYGFRPGRGTKDALRRLWRDLREGNCWIVDADIRGFFDSVCHELLIDLVAQEVSDGRVLGLIRRFLQGAVLEDGHLRDVEQGTPQGGVLSPLLANIYLHGLDQRMAALGVKMVRYADDFVLVARTRREAEEALDAVREDLKTLGLELHPTKTRVVHVRAGIDFLGYHVGQGYSLYAVPRENTLARFRKQVRHLTRRNQHGTLRYVVFQLNKVLRGWGQHFAKAHVVALYGRLHRWTCWRLRAFVAGHWRNCLHKRLPDTVLVEQYGLVSLPALARQARLLGLAGSPATCYRKPCTGKPSARFGPGVSEVTL